MKRLLLLPLLLGFTSAVNANESSYFLVIGSNSADMISIPMETKALCDEQLKESIEVKNWSWMRGYPTPNGVWGKCIKSKL